MPDEPGAQQFDALYRAAGRDPAALPWADEAPHPTVVDWLDGREGQPGRAIVVACGIGDDAEALAARGWNVTAFDISPTAIEWCRERFPHSAVSYEVADLFNLPSNWPGSFDLVVEVWTVQSVSPHRQADAMRSITELVAPGGALLLASIVRAGGGEVTGPPWPPSRDDLGAMKRFGLTPVATEYSPSAWPGFEHLEAEYRRPA